MIFLAKHVIKRKKKKKKSLSEYKVVLKVWSQEYSLLR